YPLSLLQDIPVFPALHSFPTRRSSDLSKVLRFALRETGVVEDELGSGALLDECETRDGVNSRFPVCHAPSLNNPLIWHKFDVPRSEEHTSELQSRGHLVCRLLLEIKIR